MIHRYIITPSLNVLATLRQASFAKFCAYGAHVLARQSDRKRDEVCKTKYYEYPFPRSARCQLLCWLLRTEAAYGLHAHATSRGTADRRRLFLRWLHIGAKLDGTRKNMCSSMARMWSRYTALRHIDFFLRLTRRSRSSLQTGRAVRNT